MSRVWPLAIEATCRTFTDRLRGSVMSAANSAKCEITVSSRSSRPSACANAAAVEVKLLLSEYSNCGRLALYGAHHPSATTRPCLHHHQAVHLDVRTLIQRVQEAEDRGRIDPLIRWRAARQGTRHDASLGHLEPNRRGPQM